MEKEGAIATVMSRSALSATCFLCRRTISHAPGTSVVEATLQPDDKPLQFHLSCFVAFNTGKRHDGVFYTYRIVAIPAI
jgi:hypothetical protein